MHLTRGRVKVYSKAKVKFYSPGHLWVGLNGFYKVGLKVRKLLKDAMSHARVELDWLPERLPSLKHDIPEELDPGP